MINDGWDVTLSHLRRSEPAKPSSLERMVSCQLCGNPCGTTDRPAGLTWLRLYVVGSEGVRVCDDCRLTLTEVARGIMRASAAGRKKGYKAAKDVAAAKAAND